jgi:AraC-like DNA-binding protein
MRILFYSFTESYHRWVIFKTKLPVLVALLFINLEDLSAQDTTLKNIINFQNPIRELVKDGNGDVFVQTLEGVFKLNDTGFEKTNFNISNFDGIIVHKGKLTTRKTLENNKIPHRRVNQNCEWKHLLPRSGTFHYCQRVIDKNAQVIVSNGSKFLFVFKINYLFKNILPQFSLRGIQVVHDKLFTLSYSGLFVEGKKWSDQPGSSSSNLFRDSHKLYFASTDEVFELDLKTNVIKSVLNKKSAFPIGEISCVFFKDSIGYIGGFNGLFSLNQAGRLRKEKITEEVHHLKFIRNKLFVCTSKGIYFGSKDTFIPIEGLPADLQYYDIGEKMNKFYVASSEGVWMWETGKRNPINILKNTFYNQTECYSLEIDELNQLWIGTAKGLVRYHTITAAVDIYLPDIEFNKRSSYNHKEALFFGSTEGLYEFNPRSFPVDELSVSLIKERKPHLDYLFILIAVLGLSMVGWLFLRANAQTKNRNYPHSEISQTPDSPPFTMENIEVYILNNIKTITAESLREDSGMSKNVFYKAFSQYYDITPKQLIESIRRDHQRRKKSM